MERKKKGWQQYQCNAMEGNLSLVFSKDFTITMTHKMLTDSVKCLLCPIFSCIIHPHAQHIKIFLCISDLNHDRAILFLQSFKMGGQRRADETGSALDQTRGLWDLPPESQFQQKISGQTLKYNEKSMFSHKLLETIRIMIPMWCQYSPVLRVPLVWY